MPNPIPFPVAARLRELGADVDAARMLAAAREDRKAAHQEDNVWLAGEVQSNAAEETASGRVDCRHCELHYSHKMAELLGFVCQCGKPL